MKAVFIQDTGAEIVSPNTKCISCAPLNAFTIVISDTLVVLAVNDDHWEIPIANLVYFMQTNGEKIQ